MGFARPLEDAFLVGSLGASVDDALFGLIRSERGQVTVVTVDLVADLYVTPYQGHLRKPRAATGPGWAGAFDVFDTRAVDHRETAVGASGRRDQRERLGQASGE